MLPDRIFLTGFMGSGKTTLGKKIAAILKREFIDLDQYIANAERATIAEIFEKKGEEYFRQLEYSSLQQVVSSNASCVVALGGGALAHKDAASLVNKSGLLIYIKLPEAAIVKRLEASKGGRPLLKDLTGEDLKQFVRELLRARILQYEKAHITVNGLNLTPQDLHQKIVEASQKNNP